MGDGTSWVDLLDPTAEEIEAATGVKLDARELALLVGTGEPRPTLFGADDHALGAFIVPVAVTDEDRVYYQEVDIVLSRDLALTVRRTPSDGEPFDPTELKETCQHRDVPPGRVAFHLADIVAERYLDLIDDLNEEIDEVEDVTPGTSKTMTVKLDPGKYVFFCNLAGHYLGGMHGSVEVVAATAAN